MTTKKLVLVGLLWALSLVIVAAVAHAQARSYTRLPQPRIFAGADVGFRVEGMVGESPSGTLVIRVNDRWVEVNADGGYPSILR